MKSIFTQTIIFAATAQFSLFAGTFVTDRDALSNQALASSPRAREEFPSLTRHGALLPSAKAVQPVTVAAAGGTSPRIREEIPSLGRTFRTRAGAGQEAGVTARGLAANPRALEENAALARQGQKEAQFQIAPLK